MNEQQQQRVWRAVLGEIELTVSHGSYLTWFKNTRLLKNNGGTVVIGVTNIFVKQQMEKKFNQLVTDTLKKNGLEPQEIIYKISPLAVGDGEESAEPLTELVQESDKPELLIRKRIPQNKQGLNEKYSFENFIVGAGNELAFAACQAVVEQPGTKYNPLFLYGGVGIGKTHLIQAAGNKLLGRNPDAKVLYISTEQFVQDFVSALKSRKTEDFARHYRSADVLIVDDVQFIVGKEKMQEEFFHTFNTLYQSNKQIIITSDKPPHEIPTIEERLRSRFAWGMSIDMQIPDLETRCAIVQAKAESHEVTLPNDVVEYLAGANSTNIRELEGALNQLLAFSEMRGVEPTLSVASSVLGGKARPKHLSVKQLIACISNYFDIPVEDLLGPKRDKEIVLPRQVAMYLLRNELHLSFPKIARELGRKDHTTAIHSVDKITKEITEDVNLQSDLTQIKEKLYV